MYEATGKIKVILDTQTFPSGFTKREFVIKLTGEGEKEEYPNYVALELIKDKCALMDSYQPGDEIKVQFNLNGRLWNAPGKPEKCFTSLQAWKVFAASDDQDSPPARFANEPPPVYDSIPADVDDDIPF